MSKLSDFFSMSKQEQRGAWLIAALIIILIAAVFIERKCTSDNVDKETQKQINEYVEKAGKTKIKNKKEQTKKKNDSKKSKTKSSSQKNKDSKKKSSTNKTNSKDSSKSKSNKSKKKTDKQKNTPKQRFLEPVPEF